MVNGNVSKAIGILLMGVFREEVLFLALRLWLERGEGAKCTRNLKHCRIPRFRQKRSTFLSECMMLKYLHECCKFAC